MENKSNSVGDVQGPYVELLRTTPESWTHIGSVLANFPKSKSNKVHMTGALQKVIEHAELPVEGVPYEGEFGSKSDLEKFDAD